MAAFPPIHRWDRVGRPRAAFPNLPLVLFAHSMGSFVGQTLMGEQGAAYRAVVLSGSSGAPGAQEGVARFAARVQWRTLGARAPGTWLTKLVIGTYNRKFAPNRTPHDWLSRDDGEVDAYQADPLNQFQLTSQGWLDFLEGKAGLGAPGQVARIPRDLPIYLMSGDRDPVGEQGAGVRRLIEAYERGGLTRVTLRLYEDARHELVNEIIRDEATANLVGWIERILAD